jgi:hypothetical protein
MQSSRIGTAVAAGIIALVAPLAVLDATGRHASAAVTVRADAAPTATAASAAPAPADPQDVTWGP